MRNCRNYNWNLFFFFCVRFVFTIFYTRSFQIPLEKNHHHIKCEFLPKTPISPKTLIYKCSDKWFNPLPPVPPVPPPPSPPTLMRRMRICYCKPANIIHLRKLTTSFLVAPFNKISLFYISLIIFIISFISLFISVSPEPVSLSFNFFTDSVYSCIYKKMFCLFFVYRNIIFFLWFFCIKFFCI